MKRILVLVACFALFFAGCAEDENSYSLGEQKAYAKGDEITLKSVSGADITIVRDEKGFKLKDSDKIIMFDMFGTFCEPCKKEAGRLMDYQMANNDKFMLIGLITFEQIGDKEIISNFVKPFNAYYFISNSKENERLIAQILEDIEYKNALSLPFKVVLNDGKYELLSDNLGERGGAKALYYLGAVDSELIAKDIAEISKK